MKFFILTLHFAILEIVNGLMKTCQPTFHDSFLSGGDEFTMRWEYCTKMTFSSKGYAEWHSWAAYASPLHFSELFDNYVASHNYTDQEKLDPNRHLLQIDLAIYDEV